MFYSPIKLCILSHPSIHWQSSNSAGNSKSLPLMNESRAFASSAFWVEIELLAGSPMQLFRFVSISLRKLGGVTTPVGGRAICRTDSSKVERAVAPPLRLSLSPERVIAPQNSLTSTNTNYMYGQNVRRLFRLLLPFFPLFLFELILQSNKFDTVRAQISEFGERFITRALREVPRAK